ncbi:unnamed protein product, partial [Musa hybrid cultivar]
DKGLHDPGYLNTAPVRSSISSRLGVCNFPVLCCSTGCPGYYTSNCTRRRPNVCTCQCNECSFCLPSRCIPCSQGTTIAASAYLRLTGGPPVLPSNNFSYSENFLYMLDSLGNRSYVPNPRLSRVLDILFILHAEHEMNCSTAAVRHLASRYIGPLHGGANEVQH